MSLLKNSTGQKVPVYAYDAYASPITGDAANITTQLSKDYGVSGALTDTNPVELDAINHPGWYVFDLAQSETNADVLILTPTSTTPGVLFSPTVIYPTVFTATRAGYLDNLSAGAVAQASVLTTVDGIVDAIKLKTDNLPVNPADESLLEAAIAPLASEATLTAIKGAGWTNETLKTVFDAINNLNNISVNDILTTILEDDQTIGEVLRIIFAVIAGKASGGGTNTLIFRDHANSKNRVVATVDSTGNRLSVTLDGS
jgi:hypothetical protein